jgi:hypothetical protein
MDKISLYKCLLEPNYLDSLEIGEMESLYNLYPNNLFVVKVLHQFLTKNQLPISPEFLKKCALSLPGLEVAPFPVSTTKANCFKEDPEVVEDTRTLNVHQEPETKDPAFDSNPEETLQDPTDALEGNIPSEESLVENPVVVKDTRTLNVLQEAETKDPAFDSNPEETLQDPTDALEGNIPSEESLVENSEVVEDPLLMDNTQAVLSDARMEQPIENKVPEGLDQVPLSRFTLWLKRRNQPIQSKEHFVYFGQSLDYTPPEPSKKKKKKKNKRKKLKTSSNAYEIENRQDKKDNKRLRSVIAFANKSLVNPKDIVSETLAELFLEQGHQDKAIEQYRRLSLAFPEKSAFFAELIKKIENK